MRLPEIVPAVSIAVAIGLQQVSAGQNAFEPVRARRVQRPAVYGGIETDLPRLNHQPPIRRGDLTDCSGYFRSVSRSASGRRSRCLSRPCRPAGNG